MSPTLEEQINDPTSPSLLATTTQTDPATALELVEASVSPGTRRVYSGVWSCLDESGLEADDVGVAT